MNVSQNALPRAPVTDQDGDVFPAGTTLAMGFAWSDSRMSKDNMQDLNSCKIFYLDDDRTRISLWQENAAGGEYLISANNEVTVGSAPHWWSVHRGAYSHSFVFSNEAGLYLRISEDNMAALLASPYAESSNTTNTTVNETSDPGRTLAVTSWIFSAMPNDSSWKHVARERRDSWSRSAPEDSIELGKDEVVPEVLPRQSQKQEQEKAEVANRKPDNSDVSGDDTRTTPSITTTTSQAPSGSSSTIGDNAPVAQQGHDVNYTSALTQTDASLDNRDKGTHGSSTVVSNRPRRQTRLPLPQQTFSWTPQLLARFEAGKSVKITKPSLLPPIRRPPTERPPQIPVPQRIT